MANGALSQAYPVNLFNRRYFSIDNISECTTLKCLAAAIFAARTFCRVNRFAGDTICNTFYLVLTYQTFEAVIHWMDR